MALSARFALAWLAAGSLSAQSIQPPQVNDASLRVELFASEPLIQQPIGMAFDQAGRLLVIESHTHFRPKDWKGPEHDQIIWLQDSDGDGRADKREVFFGETDMTMDLAAHPDGSIYASTRNEVLRLRDENDDGKADKVERKIIWMESEGRYPHNGLSGLAVDSKGDVYLGMGENLGARYTLMGTDGTNFTDQGEGGDIWHFTKYGKRLKRIATGFWNAFGVCVDPWDNVFATDNDPDSSPPCRLHHVVQGGDYGYQFRYGRSGLHPFISWNGQRPGTLPMLAGTGEAPCDVVFYGPDPNPKFAGLTNIWHGTLLVASWVDHRIESYRLSPESGTFKAQRKILCQGGPDFRPVAFAVARDGSLFVSDWVKRDYELHGHGRIWRISAKVPRDMPTYVRAYPPTSGDIARERILSGTAPTIDEASAWLSLQEPYLFAAAVERLSREAALVKQLAPQTHPNPRLRAGLLLAARRGVTREGISGSNLPDDIRYLLEKSLADADAQVSLLGLHWISDERIQSLRYKVENLLNDPALTPDIYYAVITTLARLDSEQFTETDLVKRLKKDILDPTVAADRRRLALEILPDRDRNLGARELEPVIDLAAPEARAWLVHVLGLLRDRNNQAILRKLALDPQQPAAVRASALVHFEVPDEDRLTVARLTTSAESELQRAALQALQGTPVSFAERQTLTKTAQQPDGFGALVSRLLDESFAGKNRPATFADIQGWSAYLHNLPGDASIENGRRVFASAKLGMCATCHRVDGIGSTAGPNLSRIAGQMDGNAILESILQPNRNVAPQWEAFIISTIDGQTRTAFQLAERGGNHVYADLTGQVFDIKIDDIVKRDRLPTSIMPEGLVSKLTDEELRDLLAFLSAKR